MHDVLTITDQPQRALGRLGTLTTAGRVFIVVSLLSVSPYALHVFGWQYYDIGGNPLTKFHPATLVSIMVLLLQAAAYSNPVTGLIEIIKRQQSLIPYIAANIFMIAYSALILKLPVTTFIETFLGAAVMFVIFRDTEQALAHKLALVIHGMLIANALLGFYELAANFRLTPLVINGEDLQEEPRSTALLGHPLGNAILMGSYIVIMAQGGARDLPAPLRPVVFIIALASLIPFGGRAATAAVLVCLGYVALRRMYGVLRGDRFDTRNVIAAIVGVPLALVAMMAAYELGAFDTLANRIIDDDGSAGTRIEMFALFRYLSAYDLVFGPDAAMLTTWIRLHGLEYGLESFIVAFVLNYGLLCTVLFFPPFALFLYDVKRSLRPGAGLVIIQFIAVALTSVSLSAKSSVLAILIMLMTILLRPGQRADAPDI